MRTSFSVEDWQINRGIEMNDGMVILDLWGYSEYICTITCLLCFLAMQHVCFANYLHSIGWNSIKTFVINCAENNNKSGDKYSLAIFC